MGHTPKKFGYGICCPLCESENQTVIDSRPAPDGKIRRRRECDTCKHRFTTFEILAAYEVIDFQI